MRKHTTIAIVVGANFIVAATIAAGVMLNRIDEARTRVRDLKTEIMILRAAIPSRVEAKPNTFAAELQVCKSRTEWLRIVLETFVPVSDRVRLPDPPPGWQRWPAPNPNE